MTAGLEDHPFSPENVARESGSPGPAAREWRQFRNECERLLGHNIDGNDVRGEGVGYSLDEAYDLFLIGKTPHAYAAMVATRERYRPA